MYESKDYCINHKLSNWFPIDCFEPKEKAGQVDPAVPCYHPVRKLSKHYYFYVPIKPSFLNNLPQLSMFGAILYATQNLPADPTTKIFLKLVYFCYIWPARRDLNQCWFHIVAKQCQNKKGWIVFWDSPKTVPFL